jgi:hypothetical protein
MFSALHIEQEHGALSGITLVSLIAADFAAPWAENYGDARFTSHLLESTVQEGP